MTDAEERGAAIPGWYPDQTMTGSQRYWDGTSWTEHVAPMTPLREDDRMAGQSWPTPVLMVLVGAVVLVVFGVIAVIASNNQDDEACDTLRSISPGASC
ncbi:DUF2510 domain-containing protein [Nocardioides rubriscoriae]|uniref:DUF2510 domain-containing protein n=1 Tax=Nocardioides rubriscoriae TaxID=642762 RepID=UPI0011E002D3|nr:DUF2510 domain-containing protein [Nocardioides rubriscoriae]